MRSEIQRTRWALEMVLPWHASVAESSGAVPEIAYKSEIISMMRFVTWRAALS